MDEGSFGVHQIEFVVESRKDLSYGCCVAYHAASSHYFGHIAAWDHCGRLVVDAYFEASRAPVHELDGSFCLYVSDRAANVLGNDVASV